RTISSNRIAEKPDGRRRARDDRAPYSSLLAVHALSETGGRSPLSGRRPDHAGWRDRRQPGRTTVVDASCRVRGPDLLLALSLALASHGASTHRLPAGA